MIKFVKHPNPQLSKKQYEEYNHGLVNLALVMSVNPTKITHYPDNEGAPGVQFWFAKSDYTQWAFNSKEERDNFLHLLGDYFYG